MTPFGKFRSISAFLDSYQAERQKAMASSFGRLSIGEQLTMVRASRDLVEVSATIAVREPDDEDGDRHYRLRVNLTEVQQSDPDIDADLRRCLSSKEPVFVAIRYGDRMGILEPVAGLEKGVLVHMRGEWIPRERAHAHGGEQMSVLHFTHHPIGFICIQQKCYS